MALRDPSRRPSHGEFEGTSPTTSRLVAKGAADSNQADVSPGLSTRFLELRLIRPTLSMPNDVGLTERDVAILQALDSYRYLDRHQIQRLFFQGPRSCQYRLKWLVDRGLIHAWRTVIRPGHVRSASICLLGGRGATALAHRRGDDARPYVMRAQHALGRNHHLIHDLEANEFFVELASETGLAFDVGVYHWVGEHGIRAAYAEEPGPVADGWSRVLVGDRELFLHLEYDRGSEQTRRLHSKLAAYVSYFRGRSQATCNHVLFVVPTEQREQQVRRVARRLLHGQPECCRVWTTRRPALAVRGPLAPIWLAVGGAEERIGIVQMPSRPAGSRPISDCIGKARWWERRPGGGEGV